MSDNTTNNPIRAQAGEDDARLAERMKAIMTQSAPKTSRSRSSNPKANPDWLKSKPKAKPAAAEPRTRSEPTRRTKKPTSSAPRPPKNSAESWQLAAEKIAQQSDN